MSTPRPSALRAHVVPLQSTPSSVQPSTSTGSVIVYRPGSSEPNDLRATFGGVELPLSGKAVDSSSGGTNRNANCSSYSTGMVRLMTAIDPGRLFVKKHRTVSPGSTVNPMLRASVSPVWSVPP